jgi:hypothetical protein
MPLLMRMMWTPNETVSQYLHRAARHILGCISRTMTYTQSDIVDELHLQPAMPFIYQRMEQSNLMIGDTEAQAIPIVGNEQGAPINVHVFLDREGRLEMRIFFLSNLYSHAFIHQFMDDFGKILEALTTAKTMKEVEDEMKKQNSSAKPDGK